jgi:SET domain-containing protein
LFADEFIHKGNIILILKGTSLPISTKTSIRIRNKNIEHYEGGYMNHHCDPNTKILVIEDIEEGIVVAKKDIHKGEEITFDYETTEPRLPCLKCLKDIYVKEAQQYRLAML